jgi:hypothetical protein
VTARAWATWPARKNASPTRIRVRGSPAESRSVEGPFENLRFDGGGRGSIKRARKSNEAFRADWVIENAVAFREAAANQGKRLLRTPRSEERFHDTNLRPYSIHGPLHGFGAGQSV